MWGGCFANISEAVEGIAFHTMTETACNQMVDAILQQFYNGSRENYFVRVIGNTDAKHLFIPEVLQGMIVAWCYHYLEHHGYTHLEDTIKTTICWKTMYTYIYKNK